MPVVIGFDTNSPKPSTDCCRRCAIWPQSGCCSIALQRADATSTWATHMVGRKVRHQSRSASATSAGTLRPAGPWLCPTSFAMLLGSGPMLQRSALTNPPRCHMLPVSRPPTLNMTICWSMGLGCPQTRNTDGAPKPRTKHHPASACLQCHKHQGSMF